MRQKLQRLKNLNGFIAAYVVDAEAGATLAGEGGCPRLEQMATESSKALVTRGDMNQRLGLPDAIEDVLITLDSQYYLQRPVRSRGTIVVSLFLDRLQANLALGRYELSLVENSFDREPAALTPVGAAEA